MHRFLILEDEQVEAMRLKEIIEELPYAKQVLVANNLQQARELLTKHTIDIFLLDVNLPDTEDTGLDFAKEIRANDKYKYAWIIFITAFEKYAYEAVSKIHSYSYLVKPYDKEAILKDINEIIGKKIVSLTREDYLKYKSGKINIRIPYNEIIYIESLNRKCYIYTQNQIFETGRVTLASILVSSTDKRLIQCHRSYIINIGYVKEFDQSYRGAHVHMAVRDIDIPVGTNYVNVLSKML